MFKERVFAEKEAMYDVMLEMLLEHGLINPFSKSPRTEQRLTVASVMWWQHEWEQTVSRCV